MSLKLKLGGGQRELELANLLCSTLCTYLLRHEAESRAARIGAKFPGQPTCTEPADRQPNETASSHCCILQCSFLAASEYL